jgi:hypothetical protein
MHIARRENQQRLLRDDIKLCLRQMSITEHHPVLYTISVWEDYTWHRWHEQR